MSYSVDLKGRCYKFSLSLISFIDTLPNQRSCWIITDQVLRSGTSIGANLVEGTASSSRLEFKKFYEIALKSSNETKY
jgi:four helix bundle protein